MLAQYNEAGDQNHFCKTGTRASIVQLWVASQLSCLHVPSWPRCEQASQMNQKRQLVAWLLVVLASWWMMAGQLLAKSLIAQLLPPTARHGGGEATVDKVKPCTTTLKRLLTTLQATVATIALQSRFWKSKLLL